METDEFALMHDRKPQSTICIFGNGTKVSWVDIRKLWADTALKDTEKKVGNWNAKRNLNWCSGRLGIYYAGKVTVALFYMERKLQWIQMLNYEVKVCGNH